MARILLALAAAALLDNSSAFVVRSAMSRLVGRPMTAEQPARCSVIAEVYKKVIDRGCII
jgi:hypothetical protein